MPHSPAVKWNGRDYYVCVDLKPTGRFAWWIRFLFEWMGGL